MASPWVYNHRISRPLSLGDHAVSNKAAIAAEQYDITFEDVGVAGALDDQGVARAKRWAACSSP